jgi:hypothetical protein
MSLLYSQRKGLLPWRRPRNVDVRCYQIQHTTVGRTPLDEGPARRRDLYLTTHNTHKTQTSMPLVGFESTIPVSEESQTHALDCTATGIGNVVVNQTKIRLDICPERQLASSQTVHVRPYWTKNCLVFCTDVFVSTLIMLLLAVQRRSTKCWR